MIAPVLKSSFPPVADAGARVLILGSLPGEVSLARAQYYANPRNQFWRLIEGVAGVSLPADYAARLAAVRDIGIALWDTVKAASRTGSLDGAIRNPEANALADLVAELPALQAIAFNGGKASAIGRRQLGDTAGLALITLPSSSPALTVSFDEKLAAWRQIRPFLRLPQGS